MKPFFVKSLFLGLLLTLTSYGGFAQSVEAVRVHNKANIWMDSNPSPDETILYQCDGLESRASGLLKKLGATNVRVSCFGNGDPEHVSYSPSLTLQFDSVKTPTGTLVGDITSAQWSRAELRDSTDCETTQQIFDGVKKYFEVKDLVGESACYRNDEPYHYSFSILAPTAGMD